MNYQGHAPSESEGWKELAYLREMYGTEWGVFLRDDDPDGRYLSVKVFASTKVEHKANYWLFWDRQKQKLKSRGPDAPLMKATRPELYKTLQVNLSVFD